MRTRWFIPVFGLAAISLAACSADTPTSFSSTGPWLGNWVQVNFLANDDNGVWDQDDLTGIGFVATVTANQWVITDDHGAGCALTSSYSVDASNRFSRQTTSVTPNCPQVPLSLWDESGQLEFSNNDTVMIEWFDLIPGDELVAFKWVRR